MQQGSTKTTPRKDGIEAEKAARRHLEQQGLRILTTNYTTKRGEIDIIAHDIDTLVFVEVRYRTPSAFGDAFDSISRHKQKRIIATAQNYLQRTNLTDRIPCRFDVIGITPDNSGHYHVEWLRDAFSAF